jgi:signal transduction histidine kinase
MVDQLFWDAHEITELRNCLIKNGYTKDYEISMVNRHGKRLDVLVTANLRTNDQGEPGGFEGFIRDITAKKQFEKQLAQTKRLASVGQLAAGVAHEINNPLGVIKCYADLIKKSTSDNSQTAKDVKIIKKHTESCQKIVDDLLNFSRISVPQRKKICIHDGVREVLAIMNKQLTERRIEVECQFGTHVPSITADPEKLKQVCLNIIMNAAQSIETQGRITIETDFDHLKKIVNIRIADTGAGISAKNQEKIFDPFFTTKKAGQGTGLGLSISYAIVRDHGGAILVKSALRRGSEFIISLPADTS